MYIYFVERNSTLFLSHSPNHQILACKSNVLHIFLWQTAFLYRHKIADLLKYGCKRVNFIVHYFCY